MASNADTELSRMAREIEMLKPLDPVVLRWGRWCEDGRQARAGQKDILPPNALTVERTGRADRNGTELAGAHVNVQNAAHMMRSIHARDCEGGKRQMRCGWTLPFQYGSPSPLMASASDPISLLR